MTPELSIRPLTPRFWPALVDLFGPLGACNGCWCMYWRIGAGYRRRPAGANRSDFESIVRAGPPPGLLALCGELAVGWVQVTPRSALPRFAWTWRLPAVDATPVWSLSCLYVRKGWRRRGVTAALIDAAIAWSRAAGAPALEAYPLDAALTPSASGTGFASTFARAGFVEVARRVPPRPVMRFSFVASE
ncbi:MAG TPA: GNAT family N-acetyltransferase [Caulobacteraceae bacterium]|nr:GNAT family N-acetyltransferase [Caulobacteraceae bacterium]